METKNATTILCLRMRYLGTVSISKHDLPDNIQNNKR